MASLALACCVIFDGLNAEPPALSADQVISICDRKAGVGADGIIIIGNSEEHDFSMRYINADGSEGGMCGNGARCAIKFASNSLNKSELVFSAPDGEHRGWVDGDRVKVTINTDTKILECKIEDRLGYFVNTGSPHFVTELIDDDAANLLDVGRKLRHNDFFRDGANIDFFNLESDKNFIRTYERGVEDETGACGTGAVAAALVLHDTRGMEFPIDLEFSGGTLRVDKSELEGEMILEGYVKKVFQGYLIL